ncbi:MAG: branched-chain amino acid ABC transporter permease [Armatimonadota bacterium]|nr:branched-chain amino acid ABC transporter permease [Armatimonadota bacterium]MDR7456556.1 branched-chain amino acid ABC transporter permease [Armatimonadota bacterium]
MRDALAVGLLSGAVAVYLALVGVVEQLHGRLVLAEPVRLSLGQVALFLAGLVGAMAVARRAAAGSPAAAVLAGALAGVSAGAVLSMLVLAGPALNVRAMFVNASPPLFDLITLGRGPGGVPAILALWGALGAAAGAAARLPAGARRPLAWGAAAVLLLSIFQELAQLILQAGERTAVVADLLFTSDSPTPGAAAVVFVATVALNALWRARGEGFRRRTETIPPAARRVLRMAGPALAVVAALLLPAVGGAFISQVLVIVGLYTLMGLGLNLEVGFAGLLDLGFVAFFAIGAYTVGLLTSVGSLGIAQMSFWAALPVAVIVALVAGVVLGIPVLGIRGDYLAIATLGFGEIVRLLVLSDFLRPWLGGSQGLLDIPKPVFGGVELVGPEHLFYVTLAFSALVAYVAWRLQDSRLGRVWMAIREDEDVAEALGVDLVSAKLLAYGLGAAFAGVGGAIFAVMLGSVFPHSFQLLISINVLALIIVGGLGSLPGVIVGALALVGLPELLREFGEFRFLVYGALLVVMMLLRPEGLWPAAEQRRELREHVEATEPALEAAAAPPTAGEPTGG